tara:strand:+ start:230 stop:412 length:183 start_codon:yes stop_codon:yes gene_type:complete
MTRNKFKKGDLVVHFVMDDLGIVLEGRDEDGLVYRVLWCSTMSETVEYAIDLISWKNQTK